MPPSRSVSSAKKAGGKAPGAVRAKSGCYTCRIRRKKCDEKQDANGHCETCVRLKIQCLGFGAKRPEWLRENSRVVELRERIKNYLASQGMIKGHSGSGPKGSDHESPVLVLNIYSDDCSSATESPATPSLTLSPGMDPKPFPNVSSIRDSSPTNNWVPVQTIQYNSSGLMPTSQTELELVEEYHSSSHNTQYTSEPLLQFSPMPVTSSHTLPSTWTTQIRALPSNSMPLSLSNYSSFSSTYYLPFDESSLLDGSTYMDEQSPVPTLLYSPVDHLFTHYATHVIPIEYLLADRRTHNALIQSIGAYGIAGDAARLLSSVHQIRSKPTANPHRALDYPEISERYNSLKQIFLKPKPDEDDAFAALQVISAFLFDGGMGGWKDWLQIAWMFCDSILWNPNFRGPSHAVSAVPETTRFIILTSMWFDVLASVTLGQPPHFLEAFRHMYSPRNASIEGGSFPELSMMPIMGCENITVWALAEISNLAKWKQEELACGRLSVPKLVERAAEIEQYLLTPPAPLYGGPDSVDSCRIMAARIFRSSARVYLHSVVSGNRPSVPEIASAVADTIDIINEVPDTGASGISRSVMRSTVFSIFICGALTDIPYQRETLLGRLKSQHHSENVGNCTSIYQLLRDIWSHRDRLKRPADEVLWREALNKAQVLLV